MFRPASRAVVRAASSSPRALGRAPAAQRRLISTAPPTQKSRSWKNSLARWGIAGAAIYYYNTSNVFAEEPAYIAPQHAYPAQVETENLPTIEQVAAERRKRAEAERAQKTAAKQQASPEQLEQEADQQGAFNPETGEINWDCPCLGGMAHGPCGEEFKAAFSCFVYSKEEPKGMDCIDRFKGMQDCFRKFPEIYGEELEGDEEDSAATDGVDVAVAQDLAEAPAKPVEAAQKPASES